VVVFLLEWLEKDWAIFATEELRLTCVIVPRVDAVCIAGIELVVFLAPQLFNTDAVDKLPLVTDMLL